jgi:toxin HigB-1
MDVLSVKHKGLRRLIETDDARGLRPDMVGRVRNIIAALLAAQDMNGVEGPPGWRIHELTGDRAGTWSIWVTGNWRITLRIEDSGIADLDLEDYH